MKKLIYTVLIIISSAQFSYSQEENEKEKKEGDTLEAETQEIIITGTRTPEKIIDIPFSVFKVDKKELKYGRNLSLKDVLADVPGLFLQTRYGSHDTKVAIRGYGTRSNTGVRGIRILQDAIPESEPDGETNIDAIDYSSLSTVEVAKGNLSSLYTNAPGGVINFITDMEFSTNYVKQTNQIGSFELRQNGLKTGLMTKNYKYFLSYNYRNYDGFRDHSNEYIHLVNSVLQIYPDSKTTISVLGNFAKGLIKSPGSLTKEQYETDPTQAYSVAVSSDFKRDLGKGRLGVRYNTSFGKKYQNEFEATGYFQIRDMQYTTNTLYTFNNRFMTGGIVRYANKSDLFSHKNVFSTGIDYNYVYAPYSSFNNVNGNKGDDLQNENIESLNNTGIYVQNQFYFYKDITSVFVSGRYDDVNISNDNQIFSLQNSVRRFSRFTPRIALNYKFTPKIALYTSYGYAFNTPAAAELVNYPYSTNNGLTTLNPDLEPEKSKNFELGIKGNIFGKTDALEKVFFEITFYNTVVENEIVPFVINDATYFRNAAKTNRRGIEMGLKVEMLEGLELMTNYTYSDFNYDDYNAINFSSGGDTLTANYSGNVVPGFPTDIVNFIANYKFRVSKDFTGLLQWDMDYISGMFVDDANSDKTSDYFYGNCMVGMNYSTGNFNFLLTGGVKNIFDRKYVGYVSINANPELPQDQRRYYEPGEPRNFYVGLNLGYRF